MYKRQATAGIANLGDALLQSSSFHDLLGGKVEEIGNLYERPLKNAPKLNEIGEELADTYHVRWLPSDFKKKNGYKRSTELSHEYGMYRQDYCGCVFSYRERHPETVAANADAPSNS